MIIVADDKIPYLGGALEPFAEMVYLPGQAITSAAVRDADALVTRTRTVCDQKLREKAKSSAVKPAVSQPRQPRPSRRRRTR